MNPNQSNPHLNYLDQLEEAGRRWRESEWLLNHLKTEGSQPPKQPKCEELILWMRKQ